MSNTETDERLPFTEPSHLFEDFAEARATPGLTPSAALNRIVVARYDEIVKALHDPATFSSLPTVPTLPSPWREKLENDVPNRGTLIGHDNPIHDRLRAAVNTFFVPRRIARFEPWIERTAHELFDGFSDSGTIEIKRNFALPMPLKTIAHVVGLDDSRAEWIGFALAFFLGPRDTHYKAPPEEKADALIELHRYVREVMEERRLDRRDDLISHVWNVRDAGEVEMSDWEMLSLFPGLMLAGHETTSNLLCMSLAHLLVRPGAYGEAQVDDESRKRVLEELLRYESAISGMPRVVTRDTVLGGTELRAGEEVFLAYASGSRDPKYFTDGEELVLDRRFDTPHLGFGQGIHACLGAPLARLLLKVELRVFAERLPGLELVHPYEERQYAVVSEGRGMPELEIAWDGAAAAAIRRGRAQLSPHEPQPETISVRLDALDQIAAGVAELTLTPVSGALPQWSPGAHIDLHLGGGIVRSYSLTGDPSDIARWRVAVLLEESGRGGSAYVHDGLAVGDVIEVAGPRNHFELVDYPTRVFIAGGIGVTPLLPMILHSTADGADWRLVYLGGSRERMAYADVLERVGGERVTVWPADERGRFDLTALFDSLDTDTMVYCCGPEHLLDAVEKAGEATGIDVRAERFAPRPRSGDVEEPFVIELGRSGREVAVPVGVTALDALNRAGCAIMSTCREGTCGTCEVGVLAGTVDHRDSVLTRDERASNEFMMTCVSRAVGDRIVVDL